MKLGGVCDRRLHSALTALVLTLTAATAIEPPGVAAQDVLPGADPQQAAAYEFTPADQRLLEAVQRGCFNYLWKEVGASSGLVKDRRLADVCSVGGVGFQLTSLPIGVERRWITRDQGQQRALSALRALAGRSDNRKHGVLLHFVDLETGGMLPEGRSEIFSTVDHALFLAGAIAAAKYFDGEVASIVDELIEQTHWKAYDVAEDGFVSMGWDPRLPRSEAAEAAPPPAGADRGGFVQPRWHIASDEERLVYFLAAGAPRSEYAVEPTDYYRLQRTVKRHENMPPLVVSWNGSAFTYFFAHCWIDYRRLAPDDPQQFGVDNPRVDWFENSRRAMLTQRERCIEAADRFKTFSDDRWGVAPCTGLDEFGRSAYLVQSVRPNLMDRDQWMGGTIAPYAAGSAIMFTPHESLAALREYRALTGGAGEPLLWSDPQAGGYGLADSFNLDQGHVSDDQIAIDAGPMLLAIENVRSGLPWRLFMEHAVAKRAVERLKLQRREP